ncbi:NUDIX hydrolase [Agromyces arachidis]|uniref:NUDIX hydrolase n=1 Tax=Agromyces arachidis TaxID=766966 RepID=UPI004055B337
MGDPRRASRSVDADGPARTQLAALVGDPWLGRRWEAVREPVGDDARAAAVLILFGVLDHLPSDHEAQSRAVSRDLDVLLLARATTLRSHAGQIAFPGGRVDDDDPDPVAAALREAREETGLDPGGVEVLGTLEQIPLAYSRHLVTPVLGWWAAPTPVAPVDEAESSAVFRTPVADLLDPEHRRTTVLRRDGEEWRGPAFTVTGGGARRLVWGFTALVLDALFDRLGWTEPWDPDREIDLPA